MPVQLNYQMKDHLVDVLLYPMDYGHKKKKKK